MGFFCHTHCTYTDIKGFVSLYEYGLRYRYMIQEKAKTKAEIISFFNRYGLDATISAFKVGKSSIYAWKRKLKQNHGNLECLNEQSRAPHNPRRSKVNGQIKEFVKQFRRNHPRTGKTKIQPELDEFCKQNNLKSISESTTGRVIGELKDKGLIPKKFKLSMYAKTGRFFYREIKPRKPKLRRKGYQPKQPGDLFQIDSIVKFIWGIKRYVITAIDLKSEFTFARAYTNLSSKSATDFFDKLEKVVPFPIMRTQTDNGREFHQKFRDSLEKKNIVQFFNYPRKPQQNAQIEGFNRTIQEDFINWHQDLLATNINTFNDKLVNWLLWYNTKRPHFSLNNQSPINYLINTLGFSRMLWTYAQT